MRRATRIVASSWGAFAGFGGPEHGYFEIQQGNVAPEGLIISAIGPPCDPEQAWHLCEPALTVIPSFLITGIVAIVLGLLTMVWALAFVHRPRGGLVLILLSIGLLLAGGGLIPPLIGVAAGLVATRNHAPLSGRAGGGGTFAMLWPWALIGFFAWVLGQFLVGHFFGDWLQAGGILSPLLGVALLVLSIVNARAHDLRARSRLAVG